MASAVSTQPKLIYHVIPESRMAGIRSFSDWKERLPVHDNLAEFRRSVANAAGEKIADGVVACMRDTLESQVPSVIIDTGDGLLHLPPKISYLFRMAARSRRPDARSMLLAVFGEETATAGNVPSGNVAIQLLKDISMGEPRINSVCCCHTTDDLTKWLDWLAAGDPQRMVRVLRMAVMQYSVVDNEACSGAADVFRRFLVRASPHEREMLISALFSEARASGEVAQVLDDAAGWGRLYATRGQVSYDPEAIILLSNRIVTGSFLSEQEIREIRAKVAKHEA